MPALDLEPVEGETPPDNRLVVTVSLPPAPLVLLDNAYMNALVQMEERVNSYRITDAASAQGAADLLRRCTTAGTKLDEERLKLKRPFKAAMDTIDAAAGKPMERIQALKLKLKDLSIAWDRSERERLQREEQERQAEIRRQQQIVEEERRRTQEAAEKAAREAREAQAAREAEEKRIADENEKKRLAGLPAPVDLGLDPEPAPAPVAAAPEPPPAPPAKSEAEVRLEQLVHAPAPVAAAPTGIAFRETLEIVSTDVEKLPTPFVIKTANLKALRAGYCTGWKQGDPIPVVEGVVFEVKREALSTRAPKI